MLAATRFRADDAPAWNAFNRAARNGHLLFDRGFMDYHADRFTDASLVLRADGVVVGLLPASRERDAIHSHAGLSFGGLVLGEARLTQSMAMLDAAAAAWAAEGARTLRYKPLPRIWHRRPAEDDLFWLHRRGAALIRRDVGTAIDLADPGQPSARRRRGAAKAARAGLSFGWSDDWPGYWRLLESVLAGRHAVAPTHSLDEIVLLAGRFPNEIRLCLASLGDEPLAGVALFLSGGVWHAQYIAAGEQGRALGALDGLFLHLVGEATTAGARFFSFGISTEAGGTVLNAGLVTQKEEFGGSAVAHDVYSLDL